MTGGESVVRASLYGDTVQMADDGQAVRPTLIEGVLGEMRHHASDDGRGKKLVSRSAERVRRTAADQPESKRHPDQKMFVACPSQALGNAFIDGVGMIGDRLGNISVEKRGPYANWKHFEPPQRSRGRSNGEMIALFLRVDGAEAETL